MIAYTNDPNVSLPTLWGKNDYDNGSINLDVIHHADISGNGLIVPDITTTFSRRLFDLQVMIVRMILRHA